jgi:tRNA(adenine34) deaminase
MLSALMEAEKAFETKEIPIGAIVVFENKIIGRGYNQSELLKDSTAHAEMLALTAASNYLQSKFLDDCDLYVTVEPCLMCSGAILLTRIKNLYFGALEPKFGACGSLYNVVQNDKNNHKPNVYSGIYLDEAQSLLEKFFSSKRLV